MKLTNELLLEYADDRLDLATRAQVEQLLQSDIIAAERLRLLRVSGTALGHEQTAIIEPVVDDPLSAAILSGDLDGIEDAPVEKMPAGQFDTERKKSSLARGWQQIAASLALLVLGLAGGYLAGQTPVSTGSGDLKAYPSWIVRVVDYHTLYDRKTVEPSHTNRTAREGLERHYAKILGRPIRIPDLNKEQLVFRRGQFLQFNDQPIIQLAYLPDAKGRPVALCLKKSPGADMGPEFAVLNGLGMVRWRQNDIDYILVGDHSERRLRDAASDARTQIGKV